MEHNALIVTANTPDDAAHELAERFGGELVTVPWPEMTNRRDDGTVQTYWFHVYDMDGELVNDFMVKPWNDEAQDASRSM